MRLETLQSLSAVLLFLGLLLAALGGLGTFHFGQQLERKREEEKEHSLRELGGMVTVLQQDQQTLRSRIGTVETKPAEIAQEPLPGLSLAPPTAPAKRDILLPHLPIGVRPPPDSNGDSSPAPEPARLPPPIAVLAPSPAVPAPAAAHVPATPPASAPASAPGVAPAPAPALAIASASPPTSAAALAHRVETAEPTASIPPIRLATPPPSQSAEEEPLTDSVRATLVQRLRLHPYQRLTIRAAADNPRSLKLAIALRSAFREAGWGVGDLEMVTHALEAETLLLSAGSYPPPQEFVVAFGALAGAGFLVTSDLGPKQGGQRVVLTVGPLH